MDIFIFYGQCGLVGMIGLYAAIEDLRYLRVRRSLTNFGLWVLPCTALLVPHGLEAFRLSIGALGGAVLYVGAVSEVSRLFTKKEFGLADVKMSGIIAAVCGFEIFFKILIGAIFLGLGFILLSHGIKKIPFIPCLMVSFTFFILFKIIFQIL